jgi:hypothetical protein
LFINNQNNGIARANAAFLNGVNLSTKLQQQVLMIPDSAGSKQVKGRSSPRAYNEHQAIMDAQKRTNNF